MTDKQPEALRHAYNLEFVFGMKEAAAELRRLHKVNVMLIDALRFCSGTSYITDAHEIAEEALAEAEGK